MSEEKKPLVRDGAKGVTHREPRGVSKPRVGNPWRESIQGNVNAPVMRVRGGAPSGMPVPTWQADGAPVVPRETDGPDTATMEVQSVRRAFDVGSPVLVSGVALRVSPDVEASRAYPAARPAASSAEDRADDAWQTTPDKCAAMREAVALATWERLYTAALSNGQASFESIPVHPSIVEARTRALQSRSAPSYVVVRALPASPIAHDPSHQTRVILDAIAPVSNGVTVKGAARKGIDGGLPCEPRTVKGRTYGLKGDAVHPCQWCDSVACDHARREDLRCHVYEWAAGDRGPKRQRAAPIPEWSAYVTARDTHKAPRAAHAAAVQWLQDSRESTVRALHALDLRGVDVGVNAPRGIPCAENLARGRYLRTGPACMGSPIRDSAWNHRALDHQRVDACHFALARWEALREILASAGRGKVEDGRAALQAIVEAAPRRVWWRDALLRWRETHDAHSGAVGALTGILRARRDATVARVVDAPMGGRADQTAPHPARATSVQYTAPKRPSAGRPLAVTDGTTFTALRHATGRIVAPTDVPSNPPRIAGDAPAYPVTPRLRTGDEASQCAPERATPVYRDAPIEELARRAKGR